MQSDGGKLAFFGSGPGPSPVVIDDGSKWEAGSTASSIPGADPGAVKLKDGTLAQRVNRKFVGLFGLCAVQ
jgi:hypothetical protein